MKNNICLLLLLTLSVSAVAQDTVLTRNVTVEREFQPVIRQAGKINQRPTVMPAAEQQKAEVRYSDYTPTLQTGLNMHSLLSQPTRFTQPDPTHGFLRFGIGHPQTLFDFHYHYGEKNNSVVLKVEHEAEWGFKALEETGLGFDYTHTFSTGKVYFNLLGANEYYTRYGRYYVDEERELAFEKAGKLRAADKQNIWKMNATLGVASNGKDALNYLAEAQYRLYDVHDVVTEHQANARLNMDYAVSDHKFGAKLYSQNQIMNPSERLREQYKEDGLTFNSRHCLRIEPFYEYQGRRVMVHVGANLDLNIGKGYLLSGSDSTTALSKQVSFAPSPNVRMEAQLAPKWAILFVDVKGSLGTSSMPAYIGLNRYMDLSGSIVSHHVSSYTPVDGTVGFIFRPHKSLLVQMHGGYSYNLNQAVFAARPEAENPDKVQNRDFQFLYADFQRWKFGAQFSYHYRDYVDVHLSGDYFLYTGVKNNTTGAAGYLASNRHVYDRPSWQIALDVTGRIDSHWSVYTNMDFEGGRWTLTGYDQELATEGAGDRHLKPIINIDLGARYAFGGTGNKALDRLSLFADLQNIIHRKNMRWYGYESEGIHGRIGLTWRF